MIDVQVNGEEEKKKKKKKTNKIYFEFFLEFYLRFIDVYRCLQIRYSVYCFPVLITVL